MNRKSSVLVIIPARGGSKGIPRKNLRSLAGKPLIYYSINNALKSRYSPDVYVSSEDDEILSISEMLGSKVIKRQEKDSKDEITLDPVIYRAWRYAEIEVGKVYDLVVTLQPTSPLLSVSSLDNAIEQLIRNPEIDTIISAVNDTHLTWKYSQGKYSPNYLKRVNRQQLPPTYKETGGFLITRPKNISESNRIGSLVSLYELTDKESIDIDTYSDWGLCEYYIKRKRVLFVVSGYKEIGLGHVYNSLLIANDILDHELMFLVDNQSQLAFEKINSKNYPVFIQSHSDLVEDIRFHKPDVVINDCLDTKETYIAEIINMGCKIINFEDLGKGAKLADLVINAIYPEDEVIPNHYFGHKYFVLRDEFMLTEPNQVRPHVKNVLLSFGGVDPSNFTYKVVKSIYGYCRQNQIELNIVTGFGYTQHESLKKYPNINIHTNVQNISDYMRAADVIFTSAGRTTYEIASLNVPAIVLAQNERELTHFFASVENGFINCGLGTKYSEEKILDTFLHLVKDVDQRSYMAKLMTECDLVSGRKRVISLIKQVINK